MSKRINIYIRDKTHNLLKDYCKIEELDMSRAVDEILQFRLKYLDEERIKAEKKTKKEQTAQEYYDQMWKEVKDEHNTSR